MDFYVKCFNLWDEIHYTEGIASVYTNMGTVMHRVGNEKKAIEYYNKSITAHGDRVTDKQLATLYSNIANAYSGMKQDSIALTYLWKSLSIHLRLKNKGGLRSAYGNLGRVHGQLGNTDSAMYYFKAGLAVARELKDKSNISTGMRNMGGVYLLLRDYVHARDTCLLSYDYAGTTPSKILAQACDCLSEAYEGLGQ